jgi:DNA polymerase III gamma/tau subunit
MQEDTILHTRYRPDTIDELIGHEMAVTRIRGMAAKDKFPNAMLFMGPPSVGKTTLARAIAGTINGKKAELQGGDYQELNGANQRTIEDMRDLVRVSKFKPSHKKRIIVIDEAHAIVSNKAAADVLLKPLEDSGKTDTIWILCSMEPDKFGSTTTGKALAKRCTQFILEPHDNAALTKQAKRIIKGEGMKFLRDDDLIKQIVKHSDHDMRTLANHIQAAGDYWEGLGKKPKSLSAEDFVSVLQSAVSQDDKLCVEVIVGVLTGKFAVTQKALLNVSDHFAFTKKLLWTAQFLLNNTVLEGARHQKVWWTPINKATHARLKGEKVTLGMYGALVECLVDVQIQAMSFSVGADALLSARLFRLIKDLYAKESK